MWNKGRPTASVSRLICMLTANCVRWACSPAIVKFPVSTTAKNVLKRSNDRSMEVYKDGALSGKTKRMMAMVAALVHGCRTCILFQTDWALKLGATVEEILEACAVAISLGGTTWGPAKQRAGSSFWKKKD